jgi:FkbM family methyltransferase
VTPAPWAAQLGRVRAFFWRFHTLALAGRLFAGMPGPRVLRRRLFGHELRVDVARANPQRLLYLEGERFVAERSLVRSLLKPGFRVADVGANIGYILLLFESAVGPGGSVACFEPEPENVAELRRNAEANAFANVLIFPVAVGAAPGTVSLRSGLNGAVAEDGSGDLTVPMVRLDDALAGPVDFLKIDVEGYEGHVLAGARRLLAEHRPTLFVEIHPGFLAPPTTVDGLFATLAEHYGAIRLYEIAPQAGLRAKLVARYLGRGVREIRDREALLADCRAGRREEPFWAVCTR